MSTLPTLPPPSVKKRRRWLTWLLVVVVFFSGVLLGGGGVAFIVFRQLRRAIQHPEVVSERVAMRLTHRLDLTPEQTSRVHDIVTDRIERLQALRREFQPRFRNELDGFHDAVRAELDARQQSQWDQTYTALVNKWLPPPPDAQTSRPTAGDPPSR